MTSLYKTCFSIHTEYLLYWIVCSLPLWSLISSSKGWLAYHVGCQWTLYTSCWEKKPAKYKIHRLDVSTNMLVEAEKTSQNCILKKVPQKWVKNIYLLPIDSKTQLNNCCHMCLYRQVNVIWLSMLKFYMFPSLNESNKRYNQARKSSSKKRRKTDFTHEKAKKWTFLDSAETSWIVMQFSNYM